MGNKAQLIGTLREEFERWEALLAGLSEEQIIKPNRMEALSIKDIIAHLTSWQKINVARVEAAFHGKEPIYPSWPAAFDSESEKDLNKINAWVYETYKNKPWSEVHREWTGRFRRLLEFGEAIPENDLFEVGHYSWLKEYPLSAILFGSYEHHKEHRETLLALLD